MDASSLLSVRVGDQVFIDGQPEGVGAVREVAPAGRLELLVYVENAGEFRVPLACVTLAAEQKVVLDPRELPAGLRGAVGRAHAGEQPGL